MVWIFLIISVFFLILFNSTSEVGGSKKHEFPLYIAASASTLIFIFMIVIGTLAANGTSSSKRAEIKLLKHELSVVLKTKSSLSKKEFWELSFTKSRELAKKTEKYRDALDIYNVLWVLPWKW